MEMQSLVEEQVKDVREMETEFGKASELMEERYRQLSERFGELQELYEGRPSRPEDLELIRQLQEEIAQKDALLRKAAEDMKFYKLELINREENFNKMFGTNPNVGVMNPLQMGKPQTGKGQTMPGMGIGGKGMGMGIGGTQVVAGAAAAGSANQKELNRKNSRIN